MKRYRKILSGSAFLSMLVHPLFIFVYFITIYKVYTLCKYGINRKGLLYLAGCGIFYLIWLGIFLFKSMKKNKVIPEEIIKVYDLNYNRILLMQEREVYINLEDISGIKETKRYIFLKLKNKDNIILSLKDKSKEERKRISCIVNNSEKVKTIYRKNLFYIGLTIILLITLFYGYKIYNTAINLNGNLLLEMQDLKTKKQIEFKHNNIYEDGIEGIFLDIGEEIDLPNELYISEVFDLEFKSNGTITAFYTFIYGKDKNGEERSFLINYDKNKSKNIIVDKERYADPTYSEDMLLQPLRDTMKVIPLKETIDEWRGRTYGILYYGKRSFGLNTEGVRYIDKNRNIKTYEMAEGEVVGYTVSVYAPGKEKKYIPARYNLVEDVEKPFLINNDTEEEKKIKKFDSDTAEEVYVSDLIGYRLVITGAAAGSRFYSLYKSYDGGGSWDVVEGQSLFEGRGGGAIGMTFLNEEVGFMGIARSGATYGELYRTEDSGLTYQKIIFPPIEVLLSQDNFYNPFDYPGIPYEENGILNILVGQGADGDYNGGSEALYTSKDNGVTWEYIKEVK